jgi:hypothetical protein
MKNADARDTTAKIQRSDGATEGGSPTDATRAMKGALSGRDFAAQTSLLSPADGAPVQQSSGGDGRAAAAALDNMQLLDGAGEGGPRRNIQRMPAVQLKGLGDRSPRT